MSDLEAVILSLMPLEAFGSTVFEEVDNSSVRLLGAGIATFVRDDFIRQFRNAPTTWATPELVTSLKRGNASVLSRQELRDANSDGGLNLFAWHSGLSVEDVGRPEVASAMITVFFRPLPRISHQRILPAGRDMASLARGSRGRMLRDASQ